MSHYTDICIWVLACGFACGFACTPLRCDALIWEPSLHEYPRISCLQSPCSRSPRSIYDSGRCDNMCNFCLNAKKGEVRCKKEEVDLVRHIPPAYLRDDRERRIIDNHATFRIFEPLKITSRIERTHDLPTFNVDVLPKPSQYCVIYCRRSVAIIRCLLRLELIDKPVVILENLLPSSAGSSFRDVFVNVE